MRWWQSHLSDADLLLSEEGELTGGRLTRARRHLQECRACADRRRVLLGALAEMAGAQRAANLPDRDAQASRVRLLARLRQEADTPGALESWLAWPLRGSRRAPLAAAGLAAAALLAVLAVQQVDRRGDVARFAASPTLPEPALPRPDLTPGAVRRVSVEEVCGRSGSESRPRVAASVARQVFADYGADYGRAEEYELDFLVTPELGGTADARNLWPQPYGSTRWNAYVKDELEQLFQRLVCDGTMDITTAQREIATDWIAAYRRYFATDRPRSSTPRHGDQNG